MSLRSLVPLTLGAMLSAACAHGSAPAPSMAPTEFSMIRTDGPRFVDESGNQIDLRGVNLGNWLLLEMWMLADKSGYPDDFSFRQNLRDRFGAEGERELMDLYRANYITARDLDIVRSFGFNVVRLPFNYDILVDEAGDHFELRPDGMQWLDHAVDLCERAGLYVILDMHGVPGRQSIDQPAGRVGQNKLWSERRNQERTVWLWREIARRFAGRPSVAAYDIINEPYGDFRSDVRPMLRPIAYEILGAIREVDPDHVVILPAPIWGGLAFYGNPADEGWSNVAFTEHHYPGLFGSERSLRSHLGLLHDGLPAKVEEMRALDAPLYIGEFNPVFEDLGGGDLMRRYFDVYNSHGWAATMWSYKILHDEGGSITDNWYMVSNAEPLPRVDTRTASKEEIAAYFRWMGTMEYVIDEPMRQALTRPDPLPIPDVPRRVGLAAPAANDALPNWIASDIGDARAGGQKVHASDVVEVYAEGTDIWAERDSFRFTHVRLRGDGEIVARLHRVVATNTYAKAGLMLRADAAADAPCVMIHAFPGGNVMFSERAKRAATLSEKGAGNATGPVWMKLGRRGKTITAAFSTNGTDWTNAGTSTLAMGEECLVGLAVTSHERGLFTTASWSDIAVTGTIVEPTQQPRAANERGVDAEALFARRTTSLPIANASFETGDGWTIKGGGLSLIQDSTAHSGKGVLTFAPGHRRCEIQQALANAPVGAPATLRVRVRAAANAAGNDTPVALRAWTITDDGRALVVAEREQSIPALAETWRELSLDFVVPSSSIRVGLAAGSGWRAAGSSDTALVFDDIALDVETLP